MSGLVINEIDPSMVNLIKPQAKIWVSIVRNKEVTPAMVSPEKSLDTDCVNGSDPTLFYVLLLPLKIFRAT